MGEQRIIERVPATTVANTGPANGAGGDAAAALASVAAVAVTAVARGNGTGASLAARF